jgi:hypothetical protein
MSKANGPVLKYSQFITEKINQNLEKLDMGKGSKSSKEVNPNMETTLPKSGKKVTKEVNPNMETMPKAGKATAKQVKSELSSLNAIQKGKAVGNLKIDPKLASLPGAKKKNK